MKQFLELDGVDLIYHSASGETPALKNVSLYVKKKEFVAVLGPSGCGKTTILSLIAGLLKPTCGRVLLNGQPAGEQKNHFGYMFQRDHLFSWRTIRQNVLLGLEVRGTKTKQNLEYAEALLNKYELWDFKDKYPSELSGGMKQRVALIRTLVLQPGILLLDEPFSALDYQTRQNVCNDVSRIISEEQKTAVLVTHDLAEAISMADRVIVLTARPGTVKAEFKIELSGEGSPFMRRRSPKFNGYFEAIWKELETNDK
ncbi:MAG: ABC transporter ATP-binding protein [Firmicutes bacterium]|nr:ABC transporter ATP-binding protein [Bacillota bacterium]